MWSSLVLKKILFCVQTPAALSGICVGNGAAIGVILNWGKKTKKSKKSRDVVNPRICVFKVTFVNQVFGDFSLVFYYVVKNSYFAFTNPQGVGPGLTLL